MGKPLERWSKVELNHAIDEVWDKNIEDWSDDDLSVVWEDYKRKRENKLSTFNRLKEKKDFNNEEWIRYIGEAVTDIYYVDKIVQYYVLSTRWRLGEVFVKQEKLHSQVLENANSLQKVYNSLIDWLKAIVNALGFSIKLRE